MIRRAYLDYCCFFVVAVPFFLLLATTTTQALAPPHPNFTDYENVHQYRKRLNISYAYDPLHISAEECRYISEAECREMDEMHEEATSRRRLLQQQRHLNPSQGEFKILVLLIRFPEDADKQLSSRSWIHEVFNGMSHTEQNPAGSIREWLYYTSLAKYKAQFIVDDWDVAPRSAKYYSGGVSGRRGPNHVQTIFRWKLEQLDEAGYDWSQHDADGDGIMDHLVVLHSGYAAEHGTLACGQGSVESHLERIWSQGTSGLSSGWTSKSGTIRLGGFALTSAIGASAVCRDPPFDMGMTTHEICHGFGMQDLYDSDRDDPGIRIGGAGSYDIMANAYGWNFNANFPGHVSPYNRVRAGFLRAIEITRNGYYVIQPSETSGTVFKISSGFPAGEYLLIENRAGLKWSSDWPDDCSGILVWHVDEKAESQTNRGYPGLDTWPKDHYRVALVPADGNYDLEKGNNLGDQGDFWVGGMKLGPTKEWPNTHAYQDGVVNETGIELTFLSDRGLIMFFRVDGLAAAEEDDENTGFAPGGLTGIDQPTGEAPVVAEEDPNRTGQVLAWILSLLSGLAVVFGVVVFLV